MAFVKLAPLRVPFPRRRQTAAVLLWLLLMPLCVLLFLLALSRYELLPLVLVYVAFVRYDTAPEDGGRASALVRTLPVWKWAADFFPVSLVKTAELDAARPHVFGYHPHGIISMGAWTNFATEANNFSGLFPGINLRLLTLQTNFHVPFFRDILLHLGICSVSRKSCESILKRGAGNSIMIVVGGAAEALNAFPGTYDFILLNRYGFIKMALRHGASLVPVISFGENDIWDQVPNPKGSTLRSFQKLVQSYATFTLPLMYGRGIFNYNFGILPHRRPITSVVGAPIDCPKIENPSNEIVQEYHKKYIDSLQSLFDAHKDQYAPNRVREMTFQKS